VSRRLLALTLAALAVRLAFLALEPRSRLVDDETAWTRWGQTLARPKAGFSPVGFPLVYRPPLYPYFIGATHALFGSLAAVKLLQAALAALLVPALARLGRVAFDEATGLLAAGFAAFYPELVWFAAHFWSETVFMLLLWWALERLLAADAEASRAAALGAGLLFGLAALTRETALYFTPLGAAWLWRGTRPGGRARAAGYLLAALLVVAPWSYRNWVLFRAFVPVSTAGSLNLWQGNTGMGWNEVRARWAGVHGAIARSRHARREALAWIGERQPWWLFEKLAREMPAFWEADSLAQKHVRRGAYRGVDPGSAWIAALLVQSPYLLALLAFAPGVAAARLDRPQLLLLGFLAYYLLLHVVTHGYSRYRLPVAPILLVFAAHAFRAWRAGALSRLGRRRRALAAALALALGLSVAPSLVDSLWGGAVPSREPVEADAGDAE
jgi:4-amino-4-deoxy-L-arabinose transferase-like glycosyltransferase